MFKSMSMKAKVIIFILLGVLCVYVLGKDAISSGLFSRTRDNIVQKVNEESTKEEAIKEINTTDTSQTKVSEDEKARNDKYSVAYEKFKDKSKSYEETIKDLDEIINEDPNYYKAYTLKGISQIYLSSTYGNGDLYEKGMQSIDKALEINPSYAYGVYNKALAYELFAKYKDSLEWYEKSILLDDYVWSYYGAAKIYCRNKDIDKCIDYLKIAISKDNSVKDLMQADRVFNGIKDTDVYKNLIR